MSKFALHTYVAKIVENGEHTLTIWCDEIEPGYEYDLMWDLIEDKCIKEPGQYILCAPKEEEDMLRGRFFTVTRDKQGSWDVIPGLSQPQTDLRRIHRWPPQN